MSALRLALVGAPNSGKTTLFNGLTGGLAKVGNYPGVTVDVRVGQFQTPGGVAIEVIDLPGIYGLKARSSDEKVAVDAICGRIEGHAPPDALIVVIDAAHLRTHLHTVMQMQTLGLPVIVALNMIDLAERDGVKIDVAALSAKLGVPVIPTRAPRKAGREKLVAHLESHADLLSEPHPVADIGDVADGPSLALLQRRARAIASEVILAEPAMNRLTRTVDSVVLHPVAGPLILAAILFLVFQAVYSWSAPFMEGLDAGVVALGNWIGALLPEGLLRGLLVDGVIAGVGSVIVFLPQIVILFAFILALEASGYLARAAFLMDELMLRVGLNGRAFIPLLSSFACAIPGMMAARTIDNHRDRLTTILVAPLMTCSARLPVYTLLIGAFIRPDKIGPFNQQGLVLFGLYVAGIVSAIAVAFVLKRTATRGKPQPLILELPTYKMPQLRDFLLGLWERAWAFLRRAGTIIFATSVVLWFLASFPVGAVLKDSYAGWLGSYLEVLLRPIGFNLEIAIALIPGMAAREVAVGALGTVYAIADPENSGALAERLQSAWSMPTALAFLAWYVFAPQCFATIATARREMGSWGWTVFMVGYLFTLAYICAGAVYWGARWLGL